MTPTPSDELRATYERRAELLYAEPAPTPDPRANRKFDRVTANLAALLPCQALLDAGCGDGQNLAFAAARPDPPERLVGSDIAQRILDTAAATVRRAGGDAEFVQANLEALPFRDGEFDVVLCSQVIEHLLDPDAGMRELARVVRPGGAVVLSTDNRRKLVSRTLNAPRNTAIRVLGLKGRRTPITFPHADFTVVEVRDLVRRAGLEITHVETFRFELHSVGGRAILAPWLNRLDALLPAHEIGDLILVVAERPKP